ncbi:ABC transporter permease [Methanobrevibacter sp.]|uniref:ABC transporter permease n=1 Tax=Methanobrevibacter sp. TaxID=66852 RepID=UPI003867843C
MSSKNELFLLEEIAKRNFEARYKDSVLGILWSILKPLLIMILLTIIFSTLFANRIENYPVYLLAGKCIYDFFASSTNLSATAIKYNSNIIKNTSSKKYTFVVGGIISEFLNFLITLMILIAVMIFTHAEFHFLTIPLSIIPIISLIMMLIGIGLTLSILCMYYADIQHLWSVIAMIGMYASAIFYPMDIIPEPYHQYLVLNPIFWIIDQFRSLAVYGTIPNITYILNSLLLSAIILVFGIIIFKKFEKQITLKY